MAGKPNWLRRGRKLTAYERERLGQTTGLVKRINKGPARDVGP